MDTEDSPSCLDCRDGDLFPRSDCPTCGQPHKQNRPKRRQPNQRWEAPWVIRLREKLDTQAVREFIHRVRLESDLPPAGLGRDPSLAEEYEVAWLRIPSGRDGLECYKDGKPFDPFAARTRFTEAQVKTVRDGALTLAGHLGIPRIGPAFLDLEQLILFDTLREDFTERYAVPSKKGEHELALRMALDQLKRHPPQGSSVAAIREREMARLSGRPASPMDLELVLFVEARGRDSWEKRRVEWNRTHSERTFNPGDSMRVAKRGARKRLRL